jgi:hypothetical protein
MLFCSHQLSHENALLRTTTGAAWRCEVHSALFLPEAGGDPKNAYENMGPLMLGLRQSVL